MELFIKLQYILGKLSQSQVFDFVPKYISMDQANQIVTNSVVIKN